MVVTVKPPPLKVPAVPWFGMVRVAPTERVLTVPTNAPCEKVKVPSVIDTPPAGNAAVAAAVVV